MRSVDAFGEVLFVLRRIADRFKVLQLVADGDGGIALGRAVVGLALRTAHQIDNLAFVALDLHPLVAMISAAGLGSRSS
jgi:hypothetical protein